MGKTTKELALQASGQGSIPSFHFTTSETDAPFDAWRSLLEILFDSRPTKSSGLSTFQADLLVHHFGTFLLCRSIADGGRYRRTKARLDWDDLDHIIVSCVLRGRVALTTPAFRRLRPGDVAVLDLSAPVAFVMRAAEAVHLIVPRALLPASVAPVQPIPGRVLSPDTAMGIFVRRVVEALAEAACHFGPNEVNSIGTSVPDLLASCLGPSDAVATTGRKGDLGRRSRRYIEENLHRRDLTSSRLTHELGVSRSQLFRQFETTGGVESYIRRRRLRRCLLALRDPRLADRRIGDVAYDMGFADEAHFSRLFRQAFGLSPRAARDAARQKGGSAAEGMFQPFTAGTSFSDWVMELRAV